MHPDRHFVHALFSCSKPNLFFVQTDFQLGPLKISAFLYVSINILEIDLGTVENYMFCICLLLTLSVAVLSTEEANTSLIGLH